MAAFERASEFVACVSGSNIIVYRIGSDSRQIYKKTEIVKEPSVDETSDNKDKEKEKEGGEQDAVGTDRILAAKFAASGAYYATCDDNKKLTLWKTGDAWTQISVRTLTRRCTSLDFSQSEKFLVVGDKSGDLYRFSVTEPEEAGVLKLGHVSMLLDVCLCGRDEEYVATADRDEKVRVSCFPNAYNIQSFCLGHQEFVSRLLYIREEDILVSGSGDGTVRLWDYSVGKQLFSESCCSSLDLKGRGQAQGQGSEDTENADVTRLSFCSKKKILAVCFDRCKSVLLYKLKTQEEKHTLQFHQKLDLDDFVWDVNFDLQGDLWVIQKKEGGAAVYRGKEETEQKFELIVGTEDEKISQTLAAINADWDMLKESLTAPTHFANFQKSKLDSTHIYFEKKQQRLAGGATKRKDAELQEPSEQETTSDESAEKKAKVD